MPNSMCFSPVSLKALMITNDLPRGTWLERYFPPLISAETALPVFDSSGEKLIVPPSIATPSTATEPSTVLTGNAFPPQPVVANQPTNSAPRADLLIAPLGYHAPQRGSTKNNTAKNNTAARGRFRVSRRQLRPSAMPRSKNQNSTRAARASGSPSPDIGCHYSCPTG